MGWMSLQEVLDSLSSRARRALCSLGIDTTEAFIALTETRARSLRSIGRGTWEEIDRARQGLVDPATTGHEEGLFKDIDGACPAPAISFDAVVQMLGPRARRSLDALGIVTVHEFLRLTKERVLSVYAVGIGAWMDIVRVKSLLTGPTPAPSLLDGQEEMPTQVSWQGIYSSLGPRARRVLDVLGVHNTDALAALTADQVLSLRGIGKTTWTEMLRVVSRVAAAPSLSLDAPFSAASLLGMPLYSGTPLPCPCTSTIHPSYHPDTTVLELALPGRAKSALAALAVNTIGQLLMVSPAALLELENCGETSLRDIRDSLKTFLSEKNNPSPVAPDMSDDSFDHMVNRFLRHALPDERCISIVRSRSAIGVHQPSTLKGLAEKLGVTRARVWQLERDSFATLRETRVLRAIDPFWETVRTTLSSAGGVRQVTHVSASLCKRFRWPQPPEPGALKSFITLHPDFSAAGEDAIVLTHHPCPVCPQAAISLQRLLSAQAQELSIQDAAAALHECCGSSCPHPSDTPDLLSEAFVEHLVRSRPELCSAFRSRNGAVYTTNRWQLRFGNLTAAIEAVLKQCGEPMHFREVCEELRKWRSVAASPRNVHAALQHTDDAVLWGRGKYIHSSLVPEAPGLVSQVETWLLDALSADVPCVVVSGAFAHFESCCRDSGIPSESALYSCLRNASHHMLAYPRYPYIYRQEPGVTHIPLPVVVEDWLREAGEPVSYGRMRKLLCDEIGLKDFQMNLLPCRLANTARTDDGGFVHLAVLGLPEESLTGLITHASALLSNGHGHISAQKLYDSKAVTCHELGITGPRMLFSLLEHYATDKFDLHRYPVLRLLTEQQEAASRGVVGEVIAFVAAQLRPCTYDEIEERFIEELGYSHQSVHNALSRKEVCRYLRGCVVHRHTIGWNDDKQRTLEALADMVFQEAVAAGEHCGRVDTLLSLHESRLPPLDHDCHWTNALLADLLNHGAETALIGNADNAFLVRPNDYGICDLEDLVYHMLDREHNGAASLPEISRRLREAGVIRKLLTPGMLRHQSKVVVVGDHVLLKELA